jgi:hypothetical protein
VLRAAGIAVGAFALCACASSPTGSKAARDIKEGEPSTLNRDCKLLGTVNGRSLFGGSEDARTQGAMTDAREKAATMGATHVVFLKVDNSGALNTGYATARAYRCDGTG